SRCRGRLRPRDRRRPRSGARGPAGRRCRPDRQRPHRPHRPCGECRMMDRERFPIDPWRLVETRFSDKDLGVTETIFASGNGYLGMRADYPEGSAAHEQGTFVNGFHETWPIQHAENAYGFAEVGQTIVNVPDAKV